jgi:hypothetical protein
MMHAESFKIVCLYLLSTLQFLIKFDFSSSLWIPHVNWITSQIYDDSIVKALMQPAEHK